VFVRRRKEVAGGTPGVYVTLEELAGLEHRARGFSFLPRQPIHSLLTGRHGSRMRGRGLNFEELRGYLPGDDPRTIDWKVTARTGKPHVRVFTEERDRPGIVVVDQRKSMFFGSRLMMKSVTAAHVAALGAWRLFAGGDRVGAFVFNDETVEEIRPHRSRNAVMRILGETVRQNNALAADSTVPGDSAALNRVMKNVHVASPHDCVIAIISDFDGVDEETRRYVSLLAQHNDVIAVDVHDPLVSEIPDAGTFVVSNGELQAELEIGDASMRKSLEEFADWRLGRLLKWQTELGVAVLPVSTAEDPSHQLRRLLGGLARPGVRR
jgi:uncharacterized protein (DUF58 family)